MLRPSYIPAVSNTWLKHCWKLLAEFNRRPDFELLEILHVYDRINGKRYIKKLLISSNQVGFDFVYQLFGERDLWIHQAIFVNEVS